MHIVKQIILIIWLWGIPVLASVAQSTPVLPAQPPYPRIAGYFSIVHVLGTVDVDGGTMDNFSLAYTVGFPTGVNILKSDRIGFSFEITPFIRAESSTSRRMSTILFHPGCSAFQSDLRSISGWLLKYPDAMG